jgi:hypothetical protein
MPLTNFPLKVVVAKAVKFFTEQDNFMDDSDAYLPEPPANSSGPSEIRSRTKKLTKSSTFECPQCPQRFTRDFDRQRHIKTIHVTQTMETIIARTCTCCGPRLSRKDALQETHRKNIPNLVSRWPKETKTPKPAWLSEESYAILKFR